MAVFHLQGQATRSPRRDGPVASPGAVASPLMQGAVAGLACAAVLFNALLAVLNGHGLHLNNAAVTTVQGMIVAGAVAVPLLARPAGMMRWIAPFWAMVMLFLLLSVLRERMEVRYLGDVAIIFGFVLLGLCARPRPLVRIVLGLQLALCVVAVWELASPSGFAQVFRVQDYYIATRGFQAESFWSNSDLFVSAERPGGRLLLPGLNIHRASSLFLEPVSLGNWTVVVTLAIGVLWQWLSRRAIALLIAGNMILLVACDGRLAIMVNLLLVPVLCMAHRIPRWVAPLTLPVTFLALVVGQSLGLIGTAGDTLAGRLSYGVVYLQRLGAGPIMGLSRSGGVMGADSGWGYLVLTQSLPGLILIWLTLTLPGGVDTPARRRAVLGTAVFLSTALPISYSVFSIKTAAVLWVLYGFTAARQWGEGATAPDRAARPVSRRAMPGGRMGAA